MSESPETPPAVMIFAGLDPTGGAGLQADIETITSMGCYSLPLVTALTVQNTEKVLRFEAMDPLLLVEQARAVLEDIPVAAFKIGMLGSAQMAEAIHSILMDYPEPVVVIDPVLAGGGGGSLTDEETIDAMVELLLPETTVITPNSVEARILAPEADSLDACAQEILDYGCEYVLITGTHEATPQVANILYSERRKLETFYWERLPESYHGSGCTLSAGIAALLAHGLEPFTAIHEAQEYTWQALQNGFRPGLGQFVPNRFYWTRDDEDADR
ncbi:MAG: hydroxymethylpyrimidine/phosphomethylpyrimidine kinase [Gammaproteobacteria bacterium]|nr:hydroxymethylpyrimidine/phosphomethylpyrimidine kinase [Gammaproteobacteria bacterium]